MSVIRFDDKPTASWRPGKFGRLHAAGSVGPTQKLCINESWNDPGVGAPTHQHPDGLEEVIMVLEGTAEFWVDGEHHELAAGDAIVLPPYCWHGFKNNGTEPLRVLAIFSAPTPETIYEQDRETLVEIGKTGEGAIDDTRTGRKL
jgi:mannose-6-phosphate isomerase-like protein (cupin superfamily)